MNKFFKSISFVFILFAASFLFLGSISAAYDQKYPSTTKPDWNLHFEGGNDSDSMLTTIKSALPGFVHASSEMVNSEDAFAEFTGTVTTTFEGSVSIDEYDGVAVDWRYDAGNKTDPNVANYIYYVAVVKVTSEGTTGPSVYTGKLEGGQITYGPLLLDNNAKYKLYTFSYPVLLNKLEVAAKPSLSLKAGDTFNPEDMIVSAIYGSDNIDIDATVTNFKEKSLTSNDYTYVIDDGDVANDSKLKAGTHKVLFTYKDGDITKTAEFTFSVDEDVKVSTTTASPAQNVANPSTGDNIFTYIITLILSLSTLTFVGLKLNRINN